MTALILNGSPKGDRMAEKICASLIEELKAQNYEGNILNLGDIEVAPCLGCFGCWVKTPGVCVIDDAGRDVANTYMQSKMVVLISPITFGGYSYELKKVFDRLIPILLPFFKKVGAEIHHKMRYKRYPRFLAIGILPEPDRDKEEIFNTLTTRNALNVEYSSWASGVLYATQGGDELKEDIRKLVEKAGGSR
ncbi:MAG: flavodoxin family protein [Eubacteriales bacterium]